MREYLFRGKTECKEWVYGFYHNETSIESSSSDRKVTRHHIYTQDFDKFVKPETVGQFAGLTIKGVKAFEGDIVKGLFLHGSAILGVIAFQDGAFGLAWKRGNIDEFSPFPCMCNVNYEIIGNIYDNPELLNNNVLTSADDNDDDLEWWQK